MYIDNNTAFSTTSSRIFDRYIKCQKIEATFVLYAVREEFKCISYRTPLVKYASHAMRMPTASPHYAITPPLCFSAATAAKLRTLSSRR